LGAGIGYQFPIPEPVSAMLSVPAIMGFPLRAKGAQVGLLIVDDPYEGKPYDARMLNILTGIAHQTATALEAASLQSSATERERLEQELRVAHQIQATFIPDSPPNEPGWEIAAAWRAARQVSGDFYDFIPLHDGLWGMVIADVADKGMPAALFMAMCRTLLRAVAITRLSPAATLMRVNELLFNDSKSDLFVTVLYAVWDPQSGEIVYSSAGHNPPLLVSGQRRKITRLENRGIALGVIPQILLTEGAVVLKPGDALIAYTDGITEAMQADHSQWGMDRFGDAVRRAPFDSAEKVVQSILSSIDEFVGESTQSDDLTLWVLKRDATYNQ
jgi:serine phosphatase RsbU (regulator of sigma subunit)